MAQRGWQWVRLPDGSVLGQDDPAASAFLHQALRLGGLLERQLGADAHAQQSAGDAVVDRPLRVRQIGGGGATESGGLVSAALLDFGGQFGGPSGE
jgi:hypothetical protein